MKRRSFLQFLGLAPIAALVKTPEPTYQTVDHLPASSMTFDWNPYPRVGDTIFVKKPQRWHGLAFHKDAFRMATIKFPTPGRISRGSHERFPASRLPA